MCISDPRSHLILNSYHVARATLTMWTIAVPHMFHAVLLRRVCHCRFPVQLSWCKTEVWPELYPRCVPNSDRFILLSCVAFSLQINNCSRSFVRVKKIKPSHSGVSTCWFSLLDLWPERLAAQYPVCLSLSLFLGFQRHQSVRLWLSEAWFFPLALAGTTTALPCTEGRLLNQQCAPLILVSLFKHHLCCSELEGHRTWLSTGFFTQEI